MRINVVYEDAPEQVLYTVTVPDMKNEEGASSEARRTEEEPVRGIERRISTLEERIGPPADEDAALRQAVIADVTSEVARLKASRAVHYRGGTPLQPIEPEDIPGKILGPTYTTRQMVELAITRVFEREGVPGKHLEELVRQWAGAFERWFSRQGRDWNKVEARGT